MRCFVETVLMFLTFIKKPRVQRLGQGIKESKDDFLLEDEGLSPM